MSAYCYQKDYLFSSVLLDEDHDTRPFGESGEDWLQFLVWIKRLRPVIPTTGPACSQSSGSWQRLDSKPSDLSFLVLFTVVCNCRVSWVRISFSLQVWFRESRTLWTMPHCVQTHMCLAGQGVLIPQRPLPQRVPMKEKGSFFPRDIFLLQLIKVERRP